MWLFDANMPVQLAALLEELGVEADTAVARGWNTLGNGSLVAVAVQENFTVLLTRDRVFGETAAAALKAFPNFCVVRVALPQLRADSLLQAFRAAWQEAPITPAPGPMIDWPSSQD